MTPLQIELYTQRVFASSLNTWREQVQIAKQKIANHPNGALWTGHALGDPFQFADFLNNMRPLSQTPIPNVGSKKSMTEDVSIYTLVADISDDLRKIIHSEYGPMLCAAKSVTLASVLSVLFGQDAGIYFVGYHPKLTVGRGEKKPSLKSAADQGHVRIFTKIHPDFAVAPWLNLDPSRPGGVPTETVTFEASIA